MVGHHAGHLPRTHRWGSVSTCFVSCSLANRPAPWPWTSALGRPGSEAARSLGAGQAAALGCRRPSCEPGRANAAQPFPSGPMRAGDHAVRGLRQHVEPAAPNGGGPPHPRAPRTHRCGQCGRGTHGCRTPNTGNGHRPLDAGHRRWTCTAHRTRGCWTPSTGHAHRTPDGRTLDTCTGHRTLDTHTGRWTRTPDTGRADSHARTRTGRPRHGRHPDVLGTTTSRRPLDARPCSCGGMRGASAHCCRVLELEGTRRGQRDYGRVRCTGSGLVGSADGSAYEGGRGQMSRWMVV
jgi:hypothetical protein